MPDGILAMTDGGKWVSVSAAVSGQGNIPVDLTACIGVL